MTLDTDRFLHDLDTLRKLGAYRTGVHRPTYGADDMESRRWLLREMQAIGLETTMDGIGNVLGRQPGPGPHLLAGSHLETQNHAGWLDGVLGVVAALGQWAARYMLVKVCGRSPNTVAAKSRDLANFHRMVCRAPRPRRHWPVD